ncbi:MAG: Vitamin B12 ABC transporter, permease component BtuC [uncultured Paraburkholderia sp.]|nr:MAG: Vitamin B12 ABC transporter, permease component BtuC [uncultured Paraburkholderia sp.]CAH2780279.1 MAG: Vitamin B12 ABC transporter, permease component BtuC [uncultured Paraburkholderia sp.]CAH2912556.1 MAG: Vitamin B12 ABC transporter, permease component BtuC [uncultured Paraburkholderia sp.]CAH2915339.1 MAG: Vitamin B12 ABC transporter, permease component BtuC [uncultured Paraburkholderia sp.]
MSAKRAAAIWLVLALVVLMASLALGSVAFAPSSVIEALTPLHASSSHAASADLAGGIVRTLRLPRALAGFACGALLSMAGALLQVLLRNPLAEPYVLGVSGGAASFALIAMIAGCAWWLVDASAFAGAFVSILLVLGLARRELWRGEPQDTSPRLLLTGAVIAAGWGVLITLLLDGEGAAYAGAVRDVLTPALTSRVFGYPLILIRDGDTRRSFPQRVRVTNRFRFMTHRHADKQNTTSSICRHS